MAKSGEPTSPYPTPSDLVPHPPEVVPPAEQQVGLGEERGAHLAQAAVAAGALEAVLVPELVQGLQQVPLPDRLLARRAHLLLLLLRLLLLLHLVL